MLQHRQTASRLLGGRGFEIGALHEPFPVPSGCHVTYVDRCEAAAARAMFPEISPDAFVHVDVITDLDLKGLEGFSTEEYDFAVACHVLEHVANPLRAIAEIFRTVKFGGVVVLAIPDMRFTFDSRRPLTTWEHLLEDFVQGVTESSDDHYLEFLRSAAPHVFDEPPENLPHHVGRARSRREHAHVWTGETFSNFLLRAFSYLGIGGTLLFECSADENRIEYFSVWRKVQATATDNARHA